jgi:hypothetical protein
VSVSVKRGKTDGIFRQHPGIDRGQSPVKAFPPMFLMDALNGFGKGGMTLVLHPCLDGIQWMANGGFYPSGDGSTNQCTLKHFFFYE